MDSYQKIEVADAMKVPTKNEYLRCPKALAEDVGKPELKWTLQAAARGRHDRDVEYLLNLFEDKAEASSAALCDTVEGGNRDVLN